MFTQKRGLTTPYLELDLKRVEENYKRLQSYLHDIDICYAMKCNPNPHVMKAILKCGGNFEISSAAEMMKAVNIGADPKLLLFSNPVKTPADIQTAYQAGVSCFAFDSYAEIVKLAAFAPGAKVYVRVHIPFRSSVVASEGKFGVSLEVAKELMLYARQQGLIPYGIAFHVGSQMLDFEAWGYAIQYSAKLIGILAAEGIELSLLDIGGGFPVCYDDVKCDNLNKTTNAIRKALDHYVPKHMKIVAEPGRYLVANAGKMFSTVIGIAHRFDKKWLHLDVGALNGLMEAMQTSNRIAFPVHDSKMSKEKDVFILTGPTCDSQDTILYDAQISSNIDIGDQICFEYTGAYTTSMTENFNGFLNPDTYIIPMREEIANVF